MIISEIRRKSDQELQKNLSDLREKLRELKFNLASGKVKNVRDIRGTTKDIARILTIINEKK